MRRCRHRVSASSLRASLRTELLKDFPSHRPGQHTRHKAVAGRLVSASAPILGFAIVSEEVAAVPSRDPQPAAAIAPDTPGTLAWHRWFQNGNGPGLGIDLTEIAAGERSEEHLAIGRSSDTAGADSAWSVKYGHLARFGIEPTVHAVLPVNQSTPCRSKVAVLRLASRRSVDSENSFTARVKGSARAIAFCPPSVTQAAPSGPTITP